MSWNIYFSLIFFGGVLALASGCASHETNIMDIVKKDQQVPITLAIGPFDTSQLIYREEQIDADFGEILNESFLVNLENTNIFKKVFLLDSRDLPHESVTMESVRLAAQAQGAEYILVGKVQGLKVSTPEFFGAKEYDLQIVLNSALYHVLSRKHIWEESDTVEVTQDGYPGTLGGDLDSLKDILRSVVVRSGTAGLMGPMVAHLQDEYEEFDPTVGRSLFGDSALAWIDAELEPPKVALPPKENAFAVVIGIEEYQRFPNVEYAIRDSEKIKNYLVHSMGYPEKNIALLNNKHASQSQMKVRLETWLPNMVSGHPDAEVFVYYGGHGTYEIKTDMAYLVPYDGDSAFVEETTYSLERLYEKLGKLPVKQVTVVIDSCFSGVGGRSIIKKNARAHLGHIKTTRVTSPNLIVFTASDAKEISSGYMEKRHGLFTYFFLKGLQGEADSDGDGKVSYWEQYSYVSPHVQTEARKDNRDQRPQILVSQNGKGRVNYPLRERVEN